MVAGPLIGAQLAEFGADVVKIENADGRGDSFRMTGTRVVIEKENGATETMASNWHNVNRGKRSLTLDLKSERGKAIFLQLAADADVFLQNFRPGVAEKLGIGYDDLSALNPELIYLSSSGFGESGPSSEQRVYDAVIQARAGIAALQRKGAHFPYNTSKENLDSPPPQIGMQTLIVDKITAYTSCQSILAALYARDVKGIGGQHIKINMLDAALQYIWSDGMTDITFQEEERVEHTTSPLAPFHILPCADGHIQVVGWNAQPLFEYMAGRFAPEVLADDRFMLPSDRLEHWPEFIEQYRAALTANATVATMTEHLESYGDQPGQVPYGVVRPTALPLAALHCCPAALLVRTAPLHSSFAQTSTSGLKFALLDNQVNYETEVQDDPQVVHNGHVVEMAGGAVGRVRGVKPAADFSKTPIGIAGTAPLLGEHSEEVVRELGFSEDEVRALREEGVLGPEDQNDWRATLAAIEEKTRARLLAERKS